MKYLKMLGLAAVAAMAFMVFVGAGTASADELCTKNENPCKAENLITKIESTLTAGKTAILESGSTVLDTCTTGSMILPIKTQGAGINPSGGISTLSWGTTPTPCTSTTHTVPEKQGNLSFESVGGTNGTVIGTGSEVTVLSPILGTTCTYGTGTGTDLGTITGGTNKLSVSTSVPKTAGSFVCPASATWTAEYTITNHSAVYVINN